ncbi:MAG: nicotinate-nucleotide diphosphorylase (carboxylating), partial [Rickettsiaceae bacterium]|nr:nicotinate-nucleotide diphosphorylase (carboxylating) [Rickettsiaceae bacterium]
HYSKIIIECDTIEQFEESLGLGAEIILLDNMSPDKIKYCISKNTNNVIIEASGGITLQNVKEYAQTGVDILAIGAITHSSPASDISLDIIQK